MNILIFFVFHGILLIGFWLVSGLASMILETLFFYLFCSLKLIFSSTELFASSMLIASCPNLKVLQVKFWCLSSGETLQKRYIWDFDIYSKLSFRILVRTELRKGINLFLLLLEKARSLITALSVKRDRFILFVSSLCCSLNWYVKTSLPHRSTTLNFLFWSYIVKTTCDLEDSLLM